MGVAGIGSSLGTVGAKYDFTKMTNQQMLDASKELFGEGKITADQAVELTLTASGGNSLSIKGNNPTVAQSLSDPTQRNRLGLLRDWSADNHATPGTVGVGVIDGLISVLSSLQSGGSSTTSESYQAGANLSQSSTRSRSITA